jgi:hypothetical protein
MRIRTLKGHHAVWATLAATAFAGACGGQVSEPPPRHDWRTFVCNGQFKAPGMQDVTLGTTVEPLLICEPNDTDPAQLVKNCQDDCNEKLPDYKQAFNLPPDQANSLTCEIQSTTKAVVNATDCDKNSGPTSQSQQALTSSDSRYLQGGFGQFVGRIDGHIDVEVHVPVFSNPEAHPGIHGEVAYWTTPAAGPCPAGGCVITFSSIVLRVDNFDIDLPLGPIDIESHDIDNLEIRNDGLVVGRIDDAGNFTIPQDAALFFENLDKDGAHGSKTISNPTISGVINRTSGSIFVNGISITDDDTDFDVSNMTGSNIAHPPNVVIADVPTLECNAARGANAGYSAAGTTDPDGHPIAGVFWQIDGNSAGTGVQATGFFPLGDSTLRAVAFDSTLAGNISTEAVRVVDTTAPAFPPLPDTTATLCDPMSQPTVVDFPAASDVCDPDLDITGEVIESNGRALTPPIPITKISGGNQGSAQMSVGTNVIRWTAKDDSGNSSTTTQTVRVRPAIYATSANVHVGKDAVVRVNDTQMAAIANSGTHNIFAEQQSLVGDIFSVGRVHLGVQAKVDGDIVTASTILKNKGAIVTGSERTNATVPLPPPLGLDDITFPAPANGSVQVGQGPTITISPGSYESISVLPQATLHLNPGTYYVEDFNVHNGARVELDQSGAGTRIFVSEHIGYGGDFVTVAGDAQRFLLGYKGHMSVVLKTPFTGTLVSPNGFVHIQEPGAQHLASFTGRLFTSGFDLEHKGVINCVSPANAVADTVLAAPQTQTTALLLSTYVPAASPPKKAEAPAEDTSSGGMCTVPRPAASRGGASGIAVALALGLFGVVRRLRRSHRGK